MIDVHSIATSVGNFRAANMVLLGAIAESTGIEPKNWQAVLRGFLDPKILDVNLKAFKKGTELSVHAAWHGGSSH
ncbi:MAG: 2-oxoacid:acceptor oxidoreductase family protein [Candidatus Binatia bacterium]